MVKAGLGCRSVDRAPSTHWNRLTLRCLIAISALTPMWLLASAMPASAHWNHDARPLVATGTEPAGI